MPLVCKAPGVIDTVEDIEFLLSATTDPEVVIDLQDVSSIKPVGIVTILAAVERMQKQGAVKNVTFLFPKDHSARVYLRLAGVFEAMRQLGTFTDPQPEQRIPRSAPLTAMVGCTRFKTENDVEELARKMEEGFTSLMRGYGSLLEACHTTFSELAANVVNHACSEGGYVLAQRYDYITGPKVEIAVSDCGIGIQRSLSQNVAYRSLEDAEAIERSIEGGVSSQVDTARGYGLYWVTDWVKKHNDRELTIRSGYGVLTMRGDGTIQTFKRRMRHNGTVVSVVIPC